MSARRIVAALVRHGDYHQPDQVPSAQLPHPLTERGVGQARTLGQTLHEECGALGLTLDPVLDCSTLLRASQTASLAAEVLGRLDPARSFTIAEFLELGERSVGAGANLTVGAIAEAIKADPRYPELPAGWKAHPRFRLPLAGAESLMMAGARVAAHIEGRIHQLRTTPGPDVLKVFISHGGALRHAAVCMGALALDDVPGLSMYHCGHVLMEHSEPDRWRQIGGAWKVRPAASAAD
ncbi:histidine phosphatase family protein [Enhygromyxa salina]|uniref:Histidine phosphatase superfamily n=1 Tax=Enhygromyxa salina TaxID=215803 RepID=A0A2S9XVR3_9BACT|nr:histidine phosphatase family protein [Enhygromyxa salina]PRP96942.1 Histidine phosphatase superfamily [Enhygromyxa salina]